MSAQTSNPAVQGAIRALDVRRDAIRAARWENLLKLSWGRALVYELIFERGRATAPSFEPAIKDGIAAALHVARNEGIREPALVLLEELNDAFPDLMMQMQSEAIATRQAERASREKAVRSAATSTED